MTIETISFLLGAALIAVAILGGGIEVREIRVPQIGTVARGLAFIVGAGFVALTFYMRQPGLLQLASGTSSASQPAASAPAAPIVAAHAPDASAPAASGAPDAAIATAAPAVAGTPVREVFAEPVYAGLRLDPCYEFGTRCGEEPATAWCRTKGFDRAVDFPTENVGQRGIGTKLIGTQAECHAAFCAAYKQITCERG